MNSQLFLFQLGLLSFTSLIAGSHGFATESDSGFDLASIVRLLDPKGKFQSMDVMRSMGNMLKEAQSVVRKNSNASPFNLPDPGELQLELNDVFESKTFKNLINQARTLNDEFGFLKMKNSDVTTKMAQARRMINNPALNPDAIMEQLKGIDFINVLGKAMRRETRMNQLVGRFGGLLEGMETMGKAIRNPDGISGVLKQLTSGLDGDGQTLANTGFGGRFNRGNGGNGGRGRGNGNFLNLITNALSGNSDDCQGRRCLNMQNMLEGFKSIFDNSGSDNRRNRFFF